MNKHIAIAWIRDGVLIDRMPENAVAFALASFQHIHPDLRTDLRSICIEDLINWGFEKSGVSVSEKMLLFNGDGQESERGVVIREIDDAVDYYNALILEEQHSFRYFAGVVELLRDLHQRGVKQYITSAVDQRDLDKWGETEQGKVISGYLEILGSKPDFQKGRNHFDHIQRQGATRIYYVADAVHEIKSGSECSDHGVIPLGFANVITRERVEEAFKKLRNVKLQVMATPSYPAPIPYINPERLILPERSELERNLSLAGAKMVVRGGQQDLMSNLRDYFVREGIFKVR